MARYSIVCRGQRHISLSIVRCLSVYRSVHVRSFIADLSCKELSLVLGPAGYLSRVLVGSVGRVRVDSWGVQQGCVSEVAERHSRTGKVPKS